MSTSFDELARACTEPQAYPSNLLRPQGLRSLTDQYRRRLEQESQHLFISSNKKPHVNVLEAMTGDRCVRQSRWKSMVDMKEHIGTHLLRKVEDPQIRHVFLSADSSAAPLNCTYDMFLYLCTYHQIAPEFVDMMYSFGHNSPLLRDFHHTHLFQQVDRHDSSGPNIEILGRSGYETRVGYKLSAMEMSESTNTWTLRQTATYHSLDLKTGKSFWMTTKANDVISRRVMKASNDSGGTISTIPPTPQAALSNALQTHLIMADWCSEGWQFYINSLEMEVRGTLTKIMGTLIPDEFSTLDPTPALTSDPLAKRLVGITVTPYSHAKSWTPPWWTWDAIGKGGMRKSDPLLPLTANQNSTRLGSWMRQGMGLRHSDDEEQLKHTKGRLRVLSSFSLTEMQRLSATALKLREARMVMSLNVAIIIEMKEYYLSLFEAPDLPQAIKDECAIDIHEFKRRLNALERFIESECMRCDTLISQLKDGKTMLSLILDAQSKESQRLSAMKSEHLAESLHDTDRAIWLITFVTLIFLPGTFVAVFFSTLFSNDLIGGSEPKLFTNQSWLFASICLLLMTITLIAWAIVLQHQKARRM